MSECDKFQSVATRLTNRREKKHQEERQTEEKKHQEERQTEGRKTSRRKTYKKGRMITSYQFEQKMLKIKKETNIESLS
jgi:hypothetical protein